MLFVFGGYDSLGDGRRRISPPFERDEDYEGDEERCTYSWEETEPLSSRSSPISLDETGDEEEMGKPVGADASHYKATYPAVMGVDESRRHASAFAKEAHKALESFGDKAHYLHLLTDFIIERTV